MTIKATLLALGLGVGTLGGVATIAHNSTTVSAHILVGHARAATGQETGAADADAAAPCTTTAVGQTGNCQDGSGIDQNDAVPASTSDPVDALAASAAGLSVVDPVDAPAASTTSVDTTAAGVDGADSADSSSATDAADAADAAGDSAGQTDASDTTDGPDAATSTPAHGAVKAAIR